MVRKKFGGISLKTMTSNSRVGGILMIHTDHRKGLTNFGASSEEDRTQGG